MVKKNLVSRSEFARQAGVSAAAVTKACNRILKAAVSGKRIDVSHPDAVAYLEKKDRDQTPPAAPGLDPAYEAAVKFCVANNRYSISGLQREFKIGYDRAKSIVEMMKASGLVPDKAAEKVTLISDDAPAMTMDRAVAEKLGLVDSKKPHVRGTAAARETKKRDALEQANQEPAGVVHDIPEDIRKFADYTLRDLIAQFGTDVAFLDWLKATKAIEDIHEKRLKNAEKAGELISRAVVSDGLISTIDGAFTRMLTDGAKTIAVRTHSLVTTGAEVGDIEDLVSKQLTTFIRPTKSKLARVLKNA
jgi:hypothetical protein